MTSFLFSFYFFYINRVQHTTMMRSLRFLRSRHASSGLSRRWKSTAAATASIGNDEADKIELKHVPSLPFVGSTLSFYSGVPFDFNRAHGYVAECSQESLETFTPLDCRDEARISTEPFTLFKIPKK